jgi:hypothetical protein
MRNTALYGVARRQKIHAQPPVPQPIPTQGYRTNAIFGAHGGSSLARTGPGILSVMPTQRSGRRVLAFKLGMSAIFDLTGATIFRVVRQVLPEPPPPGSRPDPFRSAMDTIMAAHREVAVRARDKSGVTLPA